MALFAPYSRNRYITAIFSHPVYDAIESLALMSCLEVLLRRSIALVWVLVPQVWRKVGVASL